MILIVLCGVCGLLFLALVAVILYQISQMPGADE